MKSIKENNLRKGGVLEFQSFVVGCGCLPIARGGSWKNWRWGGKLLVALGATVVGEQMWENLPFLLAGEQQGNVGA